MQNLKYEDAWARAISDKDRLLVERAFEEKNLTDEPIQFSTLRIDRNYKNELLILVLVHNITNEEITFNKKRINYMHGEKLIGDYEFTLPSLIVPPRTSMPWTFIFPVDSHSSHDTEVIGQLEIKS